MNFEFNTPDELNERAKELLNEGKQKELQDLAKDNGIDMYLLEAFANGEIPFLVPDAFTMAEGKLDVEVSKLGSDREMGQIIADHLKSKAMEDEKLALAICKKDKLLKDVCKKAWDEAEKRRNQNTACLPGMEVVMMAKAYYLD